MEFWSLLPLTSHPLDFSSAVCVHFKWKVFWHFECHKETINTTMPFQTIRNTFKILFYFPPLLFSSLPPPLTMTLIELAPSMNRRIRRLQWSDSSIGVRTSGVPCTRPVSQLFPFGHLLEWVSILWHSQFLWIQDQNKTTDETWKWVEVEVEIANQRATTALSRWWRCCRCCCTLGNLFAFSSRPPLLRKKSIILRVPLDTAGPRELVELFILHNHCCCPSTSSSCSTNSSCPYFPFFFFFFL